MKTPFLSSLIIICLACNSCQKKTERCKLTHVETENGKTIYTYNDEGKLFSERHTDTLGETSYFHEYRYDSKGMMTKSFATYIWGANRSKADVEYEYPYNSDGELTSVVTYKLDYNGERWSDDGSSIEITQSNGRISGFKRQTRNYTRQVKYPEFKRGNFHREETWEIYNGKGKMIGYKTYTYENNCNPYKDLPSYFEPSVTSPNDNNILTTKVYWDDKLESITTNTYEYKRRMPVSATTTYSNSHIIESMLTYSC